MPKKNSLKDYAPENFYHIYSRGVNGLTIYNTSQDYDRMLGLMSRYLTPDQTDDYGRATEDLSKDIELNAFCLMPNHFHLLVYLHEADAMRKLMQRISTGYVMYFNKINQRTGPLFQTPYRAVRIKDDPQLLHISAYIHLNPNKIQPYRQYQYSSWQYFNGSINAPWIKPERILEQFDDLAEYQQYLSSVLQFREESQQIIED